MQYLKQFGEGSFVRPTEEEIEKEVFAAWSNDVRVNGIGVHFKERTVSSVEMTIEVDEKCDATVGDRQKNLDLFLQRLHRAHAAGVFTDQELEFGTNYYLDHYQPTVASGWDTVDHDWREESLSTAIRSSSSLQFAKRAGVRL